MKVKKDYCKDWSNNVKRLDYTIFRLANTSLYHVNPNPNPNAALKTALMNIDVLYLTLLVVISILRFRNTFLAATIQALTCYLSLLEN